MSNENIVANEKKKAEFRNINALKDLTTYRLPLAGIVSITHRITGIILFFSMPFWIWLFSKTVQSPQDFAEFKSFFTQGFFIFPWWVVKIAAIGLIFACAHYIFAGMRHLILEVTHKTTKEFGRHSAVVTFVCSISCTFIFALFLFLG